MCVVFMGFGYSQTIKQGVLIYEQKINVHANLSEEQQAMKAFIPEFVSTDIQLTFKDDLGRLKEIKNENQGGVMISTSSADMLLDKKKDLSYSFAEFGNEKFYTEAKFNQKTDAITLSSETKNIGGFKCKAAQLKTDEESYTIWYCSDLPKYYSPMGLLAVEGLVLEIAGESINYLFKNLEKIKVDESVLKMPEGFVKVTEEQLSDLTEEYMEELQQELK